MAKILVVDDSSTVQKAVAAMLRGDQHDISYASNGMDALQMIGGTQYDLVIADVEMPLLGGLSLCGVTRLGNRAHCPPVVIASSHDSDIDIGLARRMGAVGLLSKPFNVERLRGAIAQATSTSGASRNPS